MSEPLPQFKLLRPTTLEDALTALAAHPEARLCAGGTDLLVNLRRGLAEPSHLVDLSMIPGLAGVQISDQGVEVGAGTRLADLATSDAIAGTYPAVTQAASMVAGPNHREVATLGGNLCVDTRCLYYNQSHWWRKSNDFCLKYRGDTCHVAPKGNRCRAAYCGDIAPALMVHDAKVNLRSADQARTLPLADLYAEDGAAYLTLKPGEMITSVTLPPIETRSVYRKIRVRQVTDFPLAGVAVALRSTKGNYVFDIALTGTNSRPLRLEPQQIDPGAERKATLDLLSRTIQKAVSPQRTTTIAPHYRRLSIAALAIRLVEDMLP